MGGAEDYAGRTPVTADVQRGRCNYGHTEADHERAGACERPPLPGPGFSLLVADVVGEALARHAVACQGCGALVLRNLNAIEQHRRHHGLIADAEKRAAVAALEPFAALAAEYAERSAKVPDGFWKRHLWIVSQRLRAALDPSGAVGGAQT